MLLGLKVWIDLAFSINWYFFI